MKVTMVEHVEDGASFTEAGEVKAKQAEHKRDPGRFKSWQERTTDTGQLVELYVVETLYAGRDYDLPPSQAEKLIRIGYATPVSG